MKISGILNYHCIKCNGTVRLEMRPNMAKRTIELWRDMFDGKLCLSCHTGTDKAVTGAAENLAGLLC